MRTWYSNGLLTLGCIFLLLNLSYSQTPAGYEAEERIKTLRVKGKTKYWGWCRLYVHVEIGDKTFAERLGVAERDGLFDSDVEFGKGSAGVAPRLRDIKRIYLRVEGQDNSIEKKAMGEASDGLVTWDRLEFDHIDISYNLIYEHKYRAMPNIKFPGIMVPDREKAHSLGYDWWSHAEKYRTIYEYSSDYFKKE